MDITIDLPSGVDYEKLSAAVANSKLSASQVILARLVERQQSKIASMTPAERADFERRQADREKRLTEEAQEHLSSHPWKSFDEFLNAVAGDFFTFFTGADDDLADMTLDKLQERQAELEAARKRIDAMIDAQLKATAEAQDVRRRLDRIEAQGAGIKKDVADIVGKVNETQGAAYSTLKIAKAIPEKMTRAIAGASVRIQHLKEAVEKTDGNLGDLRRTQLATLAAVGEIRDGKPTDGKSTVPDPRDYQMTTTALSQLLEEKNCKRSTRQIELWEKYLKTDGREGTRPPMGYSLSTRLTPETAAAWVKTYAKDETPKNAVRVHFDDRRHQRPK